MKQRDLLFAGLLLFAAPAFAQPGITEPLFDADKDAKLIFSQDFEADFATWSTTPVDSITQMEYYDHQGNSSGTFKPWEKPEEWQKGIFRDTTMILYNGVVISDNSAESWKETVEKSVSIVEDLGQEKTDRQSAMRAYGEADAGGDYYFKFVSDSAPTLPSGSGSYSNNLAARYRRNLFVRGLDIQDNSSYRLTFYAKAKARNAGSKVVPTLYTDIMRGYFHAEKPFTMGYLSSSSNLDYNNKFEFVKNDFLGEEWEKLTYMTYYLTDSIANYYVFVDGYWWASDWTWLKKDSAGSVNPKSYDLNYTVQPDKFFVRLGFASDSTEFCIDNLSLTRSTIGGVEYYQDKLRVNFGYETDLKKQAKAAYKKNKIEAVEIPGDYFDVWGKYSDGTWEPTGIASAEYQGDGYMYLFADFYDDPVTGEKKRYTFDQYDTVLVSFINPTEEELALHYTGTLFPQATNKEWIRAGKRVLDFSNEVAALNPYVFANVYSMYDRAPVMQKAYLEDGSFGLDGTMREFKFKFSREMEIDNPANKELREKCIVYAGSEIWDREWNEADSTLTITRPASYTSPLTGDVIIEIKSIYVPNTTNKGANVSVSYNFTRPINRDLSSATFTEVWNSKFLDETFNPGATGKNSPAGTACWWLKEGSWGRPATRTFQVLDGKSELNAARLYRYSNASLVNKRALVICPRNNDNTYASVFLGYGDPLNLTPGGYKLDYKAMAINKNFGFSIYVYRYDAEPHLMDDGDKTFVSKYTFDKNYSENLIKNADNNPDTIITQPFSDIITIADEGRYIIEVRVDPARDGSDGYPSMAFTNFVLSRNPVTYGPIYRVNEAVAATQARIATATDAKYAGPILVAASRLVDTYKADAASPYASTSPSEWFAAANEIEAANEALKLRMDTVDLVFAKQAESDAKLASIVADSIGWKDLASYIALKATKESVDTYVFADHTNAELTAFIKLMDDQIKALDARVADNKEFVNQIKRSKKLLDEAKHTEYAEYDALQDTYDEWFEYNLITPADDAVKTAVATVKGAADAYDFRVIGFNAATVRIVALQALATKLGSTIADTADIKTALENLEGDADLIADAFKQAIKLAIYQKAAANINDKLIDSLDVTPFIKNYNLYQTPRIVDRSDKNMPDNNTAGPADHGANMQYTQHKYNSGSLNGQMPIWVMITEVVYDNLYPGWTVKAFNEGNSMVTGDKSYDAYVKGMPVFDAEIGMDWNGKAELYTKVADLPAGLYELGVQLTEFTPKDSEGKIAKMTVVLPDSTYSAEATTSGAQKLAVDSILVGATDTLDVTFMLRSQNGWSRADNFSLLFVPDKNFNYTAAVAGEQAKMTELLTIVSPAKAIAANVEYYTLGGVQVAAPKAGQILIRKTNVNGKVVVDKVLLK